MQPNDDIVARLRSPATVFYEYDADNGYLLDSAADEIERLRSELKTTKYLLQEARDRINTLENATLTFAIDAALKR